MTETTLTLHRILKAPRALVWRCWTDPELIPRFFIPKPHQVSVVKMEVRPGGAFTTLFNVDGNEFPNDGSFLAVEPETRLVFTDMMVANWQPVDNPGLGFTAELILADHPDGTDYTAVARHRTTESAEAHEKMGFSEGWGTVATQLEELAQQLQREGAGV
ncbi:polyketide cyclase [Rhodobacterales bacterium HKCCE3408]|nr:polyketide cyclase [Rhodobacterales bacterium HKCCE3408]